MLCLHWFHYLRAQSISLQQGGIAQSVLWLGYGVHDQRIIIRLPVEAIFLFSLKFQAGPGAHPASFSMENGGSFSEVKKKCVHSSALLFSWLALE
jgi:hypothetical protein